LSLITHESADKATAHGTQTPAVDYFYTATTRRSRGALWTIFAPAFSPFDWQLEFPLPVPLLDQ